MEPNPYAPPKAAVSDIDAASAPSLGFPVSGGLYTQTQHFVAAFIGTPIAAALLAASNYRRLARDRDARDITVWGVAATVVLFAIAFVLPDNFPNAVLPLAYSFGVRAFAGVRFGGVVNAHRAAGGRPAPWWRVLAVSFSSLIVVVAILFGAGFALAYLGVLE
jgi:hypothetical protein